MKRIIALFTALCLAAALAGCGSASSAPAASALPQAPAAPAESTAPAGNAPVATGEPLHVVTTIFPIYDWVRQMLADDPGLAEVTLLLDDGIDLHSYQPSVQDLAEIADCDVFLYVGGESDSWVKDALASGGTPGRVALDLMPLLGDELEEEELVEGMQPDDDDHDDDGDDHEEAYDEHIWLAPHNAQLLCAAIADVLADVDPFHAAQYRAGYERYRQDLKALDDRFDEMTDHAVRDTILVADRFPFLYLTEAYDLDYYAAFAGCSAETEASFATVAFLADKLDKLRLPYVLVPDGSDQKLAQTVIAATQSKNQTILTLDSMQSVTAEQIAAGATYVGLMEQNLATLQTALNG